MRREYSCANFNNFLDTDDDCFTQTERNFYPKKKNILNTENNQPSAPNLMINFPNQVSDNYENWIYVEYSKKSLNYVGKPIGGDSQLYEFTCEENNKKYLARKDNWVDIPTKAEILRNLTHNNILNYKRYFSDNNDTYILYEYCGNIIKLDQYLNIKGTLPENEVKKIIKELINLLKYLKSQKIIHRNLKLSNIIMTKRGEIKVMGFKSAIKLTPNQIYFEEERADLFAFVYFTCSPESKGKLVKKEGILRTYLYSFSYESDLWAVGKIMYSLLFGSEPNISKDTDMYQFLKKNNNKISYQAIDCLRRLLEPNPTKRIKLNHVFMLPFFKEIYL